MSFFSLIGLIGFLPVLIAQWIGVIALRRAPRGLSWWLMIIGTSINTAQALLLPVLGSFPRSSAGLISTLPILVPLSGGLLFAIGFALHGLQVSRSSQRQAELEQLTAAMSEEMDQLRGR